MNNGKAVRDATHATTLRYVNLTLPPQDAQIELEAMEDPEILQVPSHAPWSGVEILQLLEVLQYCHPTLTATLTPPTQGGERAGAATHGHVQGVEPDDRQPFAYGTRLFGFAAEAPSP